MSESNIEVQRARPSDIGNIVEFINRARPAGKEVSRAEILERFSVVGFLLAVRDGEIIGMMGWLAENLVARVTDFMVWPAVERLVAGRLLIASMEDAARELQCEAAILFLPRNPPPEMLIFWGAFGYKPADVDALPKAWREAAREVRGSTDRVVVKQLRHDLITRPM
ncbi:MAG: GNAT family N-acetyltransferase [Anaerolineae bacterium]|nr:GNAT family N-acetyltransferase [Anaerolineae bacterium]